jgi:uncharacterized repeat protein (TIGR01451 family)
VERLDDRVTPSVLGLFELDGNITTGILGTSGSAATSHDWDQVFNDATNATSTSGAAAVSFVTDVGNTASETTFQGGGSKDTLGIQQGPWLFTGSKPQAKDDIAHAYAAVYADPSNGHVLLFTGMDRLDNSGNATAGFWFLQHPVGENPNVTTNGGHPFTGAHADGDLLLVGDFTRGGSTSAIKVFRWTGDDSTGSLVAVSTSDPTTTFAIVNSSPISVPWSYTNKSGQTQPAAGEFLEAGVDLTALGLEGRFASFVAETRSSQAPTATLSDFVIGNLPLRSAKAIPFTGLSTVGDPVTYHLRAQNTGVSTLYLQNVTDTLLNVTGAPPGNLVGNGVVQSPVSPVTSIAVSGLGANGSLAANAIVDVQVTRTVQPDDPDPTTDTVTFTLNEHPDFSGEQIVASADNSVNLFQPSATLTVTADPTTATFLGQVITYTYTVTNTSSADSPNLVLDTSNPSNSFNDSLLGNLEADAIHAAMGDNTATVASIAPGASFNFTETRATQAGDPTPLTNTATAVFTLEQTFGSFNDQITAQGSASVTLIPHLAITKAVTSGFSDVIHPGDTASFTISVTNDGAGPAANIVVTDQMPAADLLTWVITSSTFDTSSLSNGGFLTATSASLPAGATELVVGSAVIPLDFFGTPGTGMGNGDPVPLDLFELDGNAQTGVLGTSGSTTPSHDWDQVFADAGSPAGSGSFKSGPVSGALAGSFVTDAVNSRADDIFTGGGSKDTQGIQQGPWLFTDGKPQGKDDITHAYAASYTAANGDQVLYAGLDRYDNSGDATAGFWFFRNNITESTNVSGNGTGPFTGTHKDGDILLVSDFTVAGSTSTIKVWKWVGDDATGSLVALNNGNPINGSTFAIVNGGPISVPWSYTNKSRENQPAAGEFLEEGINLTALGLQGCFSSFLAETRSSQSPTATLSDFVLGSFNTCSAELPNTASVSASNFNGGQPITSNQVIITLNDGDALLGPSVGGGAAPGSLTAQQVQSAGAQGISAWRAEGIDSRTLSNLDHVTVHLGDLPGAELGFTAGGEIWIDQTAAGWGWAVRGSDYGRRA